MSEELSAEERALLEREGADQEPAGTSTTPTPAADPDPNPDPEEQPKATDDEPKPKRRRKSRKKKAEAKDGPDPFGDIPLQMRSGAKAWDQVPLQSRPR